MAENPLSVDDLLEFKLGGGSSYAAGGSSQSSRSRKRKQKKAANATRSKRSSGSLSSIETVIDGVIEDSYGKESVAPHSAQQGIKRDDKGANVRNAEFSQRIKKARHVFSDDKDSSQPSRQREGIINHARTPPVDVPFSASITGDDFSDFLDNFVSDSIFSLPSTASPNPDAPLFDIPLFDINNSRLAATLASTRVGHNAPVYGNLVYNIYNAGPPTTASTSSSTPLYGTHVPSTHAIGQRAQDTLIDFDTPLPFDPIIDYNNNLFDATTTHTNWDLPFFCDTVDGVVTTEDPQLTTNPIPTATHPVSFPRVLNPRPTTLPAVFSTSHLNIHPSTAAQLADLQFPTPPRPDPLIEDELNAIIAEASSVQPLLLEVYIQSLLSAVSRATGIQEHNIDSFHDFKMQQSSDGTWLIHSESLPALSKLSPLLAERVQKTSSRMVNTLVKFGKVGNASRETKRTGTIHARSATEAEPSFPPSAIPSSLPSEQQVSAITIDSKEFFKIIMNGEYFKALLYGTTDYRGYCLGDNPFPEKDEKKDAVFYKERKKVLEIGKNAFDHYNLKSLKHMIFFVLLQYAISLIHYREKSFARSDVKKFSHERLVEVLDFNTPDPKKVSREVLMKHHTDVKAIARLLLVKNRLFETRSHRDGYPGTFTNALFEYLMDKLLFSGAKIVGVLICDRNGQSIPLVTYALIASALKLSLLPYRKHGHGLEKEFTLEKWQSEFEKQLLAVKEADNDTSFGQTFKEIRQRWAFVGANSRFAKLRERRVFLGPERKYDDSDEYSESDSDESSSNTDSEYTDRDSDGWTDADENHGSDDSNSGSDCLIRGTIGPNKYKCLSNLNN